MKSIRLIVGVVLGVVITVTVYFLGQSLCILHSGRNQLIFIGPRAQDISSDPVHISLGAMNQITWQSTNKQTLLIEFEIAKYPTGKDPFRDMKDSPTQGYRRVSCTGDECRSLNINTELGPDLGLFTCLKFKYSQQLGTSDRADGWIIIEK